jgi:amino acid permease
LKASISRSFKTLNHPLIKDVQSSSILPLFFSKVGQHTAKMGVEEMGKEKYETDIEASGASSPVGEIEVSEGESGKLKRSLKGRHMQMIAIGGSIGAGLFVGSGSALNSGGPASLVIDFIIIGIMLLLTVNALGELAGKHSLP